MTLPWQDPPVRYRAVDVERGVPCRLPDGVTLFADVYRPRGDGPWPVLLMRVPYDKSLAQDYACAPPLWYARHGYLVVVQDCRGRWASEGEWYPLRHEADDGAYTVGWAARLPGSNGRVGMYGFSYAGATQLQAAVQQPPGLATIMPGMTGADYYDGWTYRGGALHHAFILSWTLLLAQANAHQRGAWALEADLIAAQRGMADTLDTAPAAFVLPRRDNIAPYYDDWITHETRDAYWQQWSIRGRHERITVPALHIEGWYDTFVEGALENFTSLQQRAGSETARHNQKLVIGPWYHFPWHQAPGAVDFGDDARSCIDALQVLWLDRHLRGEQNGLTDEPPVALFVMGANHWRFFDAWPPPSTRATRWYLHSAGRANSLNGNGTLDQQPPGDELPDAFSYDPSNPVPSLGGQSCCAMGGVVTMGAFDQRSQEYRNDVLVYSSLPLTTDLTLIGTVEVVLYAATTAADTDFTAKLVDVWPDGRAINIVEGILRARCRESLEQPTPIRAGEVTEYRILVGSTAIVLPAGHRLRVEIASSNFPTFDRHTNSLAPLATAGLADRAIATQTVFHDARYPSYLLLPVLTP